MLSHLPLSALKWVAGISDARPNDDSIDKQMRFRVRRIEKVQGVRFRLPHLVQGGLCLLFVQDYLASRVDSWCLGWNTFYLLMAAP